MLLNQIKALGDSVLNSEERILKLLPYEDSLAACVQHFDSTHSQLLRTIGDIFAKGSDYPIAIQYYQRSIDITESHLKDPAVNPKHLITAYYNLFLFNNALNKIAEKMNALSRVATYFNSLKQRRHSLSILYTRAEYSFHIGDYHRCIYYAKHCWSLALNYSQRGTAKEEGEGLHYASSSLEWQANALLVLRRLGRS